MAGFAWMARRDVEDQFKILSIVLPQPFESVFPDGKSDQELLPAPAKFCCPKPSVIMSYVIRASESKA